MTLHFDRCPDEDKPDIPPEVPERAREFYAVDPCQGCPGWGGGRECGAIWTLNGIEMTAAERDAHFRKEQLR